VIDHVVAAGVNFDRLPDVIAFAEETTTAVS